MEYMTAPGKLRLTAGGFLLTANLVVISYAFLDERIALGIALIATGQHFLSDVIAGGYVGWAVLVCSDRGLAILRESKPQG